MPLIAARRDIDRPAGSAARTRRSAIARSSPTFSWCRRATVRLMFGSNSSKRPLPFRFAVYIATSACCISSAASAAPTCDAIPMLACATTDWPSIATGSPNATRMRSATRAHFGVVRDDRAATPRTRHHRGGPPCRRRRRCRDPAGDLFEQRVAGGVTHRVVHGLEVVEVDEQHGDLAAVAGRVGERAVDEIAELQAVREPGQRVVVRLVRELLLQRPQLRERRAQPALLERGRRGGWRTSRRAGARPCRTTSPFEPCGRATSTAPRTPCSSWRTSTIDARNLACRRGVASERSRLGPVQHRGVGRLGQHRRPRRRVPACNRFEPVHASRPGPVTCGSRPARPCSPNSTTSAISAWNVSRAKSSSASRPPSRSRALLKSSDAL